MKIPLLTSDQSIALGHYVGLSGAVGILVRALATSWIPSLSLIALVVGLIVGTAVNDYLNTPTPVVPSGPLPR